MSTDQAPDKTLDRIREQQRRIVAGASGALALAGLVALAGTWQVNEAAAGVSEIRGEATRIDAGREYAHPDFAPPAPVIPLVKLGTFVANPLDAANIRYVRVSVQVEVTSVERMERYGMNKIRARAAVTNLLSSRTVPELSAPGGQEACRAAIREAIAAEFPSSFLKGVHFTEFVVQ